MRFKNLFILALPFLIFSCSKNNDEFMCESPEENSYSPWNFPMTEGSYWVYEWYTIDSTGAETPNSNGRDSTVIIGDTLIDGELFAIYDYEMNGARNTILRRDSSGYIINHIGGLDYSYVEFDFTWDHHTIFSGEINVYKEMVDVRDSIISVPSGDFNCVDRQIHHIYENGQENPCGETDALFHYFHAPDIGEVKTIYFFQGQFNSSCTTMERRLVDYYIAPQ